MEMKGHARSADHLSYKSSERRALFLDGSYIITIFLSSRRMGGTIVQ